MPRTCTTCPKTLGLKNKSGFCQSCNGRRTALMLHADPVMRERRREGVSRHFAVPGNGMRRTEQLRARIATMPQEEREARAAWGRKLQRDVLSRPDVIAKRNAPASRAKAAEKRVDRALAWCPPRLRGQYRDLIYRKHFSATEARAALEPEIPGTAAHTARVIANFTDVQRLRAEREQTQKEQAY